MICIGIEGTAEKTGVGIVDSEGKILASVGKALNTRKWRNTPKRSCRTSCILILSH